MAFAVDTFSLGSEPQSPSLQILQGGFVTPLAVTETGLGDSIQDTVFQFRAVVAYVPSGIGDDTGTLTGSIFHSNLPTFSVSSVVNLSGLGLVLDENGDPAGRLVYFGFTAGNGLADDGHFIRSAVPVPEPSTYAMLVAGLAMLAFVAQRRSRLRQYPELAN